MDDVWGDFLGACRTTPAAVIENKSKTEILFRAVSILIGKVMGHTAV